MTDFKDMFNNPIEVGDIVLRDSYGGGFYPQPYIVYGNTPARLRIVRMYEAEYNPGVLTRYDALADPNRVIRYPLDLLDDEDAKMMIDTRTALMNEGIL